MPTFPVWFNLADYYLFDRLRDGMGDRAALRFGDRQWTYVEVAARARRAVDAFRRAGLHPGERVYIVLPDTPPFAWTFFATLKAGGVVTMGNPHTRLEDVAYVIDYVQPRILVTIPAVAEALRDKIEEHRRTARLEVFLVPDVATGDDPTVRIPNPQSAVSGAWCLESALRAADPDPHIAPTWRDAPAIWLFTSGSTGSPKAAMHCHRDFAYNTEVFAKRTLGWNVDDVCVSVPRLFFGYATGTNLMFPFAVGACAALFSERPMPDRVAWAVKKYGATVLTNVPTLMARLIEADAQGHEVDLSTLRMCLSAGEALPPALLERWQSRFGVPVYDGIGSAEMFHIYLTNRPGDIKPGSLGRPVEGYTLRILPPDAEGPGTEPLPTGEIGTLWVKGDSVAQGYWLDRDKSWRIFHGHWCRTSDLFRCDEDGYYWFCGRADHLLKVAGQWVSPLEVENCLVSHPAVMEAAVVGVQRKGLTLTCAYVCAHRRDEVGDAELALELQNWVRDRLARYKYPREVVFLDALPHNDRGKIDRKSLAEMAADAVDGDEDMGEA